MIGTKVVVAAQATESVAGRSLRGYPIVPDGLTRPSVFCRDGEPAGRAFGSRACRWLLDERAKRCWAARSRTPTNLESRRVGDQGFCESDLDRPIAEVVVVRGVGDSGGGQKVLSRPRNDGDRASRIALRRITDRWRRRSDIENTLDA